VTGESAMAAAPLAGVAVGKLVVAAVSAPACSVVVPASWLLELAPYRGGRRSR
jgi:hypothetical protein